MATPLNAEADLLPDAIPSVIKSYLEGYAAGSLNKEELVDRLTTLCAGQTEAAWEALSLLDQYNRRGLIATEIFRAAKAAIHTVVFGSSTLPRGNSGSNPMTHPRSAPSSDPGALPDDDNEADIEEDREQDDAEDEPAFTPQPTKPRVAHVAAQQPSSATILLGSSGEPRSQEAAGSAGRIRTGTVLCDRYVLVAPLGRGGVSAVFKALDRERSNLPERDRYVAIKLLRDEITTKPEARAALQREFQQAQLLSHPNIVKVFDCENHAGHSFIVMELLSGELLERVMERVAPRRLTLEHTLTIIREIGVALAHAHDHGIVHADLKPGNVMITDDGDLRVLDFGLASALLPEEPWISDDHSGLPTVGFTPAYSSPERVRGLPPDPRDDVYSLACVAFELLTGARAGQILSPYQIKRQLRQVPELSPRQRRTIARGLAATRARRPPTMRLWLADFDLRRAADHLPGVRDLRAGDLQTHRGSRSWKAVLALLLLGTATALVARVFMQTTVVGTASGPLPASTKKDAVAPSVTAVLGDTPAPKSEGAKPSASTPGTQSAASTSGQVPLTSEGAEAPRTDRNAAQNSEARKAVLAPAVLGFTQDQYVVDASATVARLTVRRTGRLDQETIFHWRTIGGSAKAERDYVSFDDAAERLAPGQRNAVILVPIVNDLQRPGTEYFEVELTDANATLGPTSRATVVIVTGQ